MACTRTRRKAHKESAVGALRDEHPGVGLGPENSNNHDLPDDISLPSDDELDAISQSEHDLSFTTQTIQGLIKDLYKLSFRIRNSTTKSTKAAHYKEIDKTSGLELFSDCYAVFDRNHIRELFRSLRKDSTSLAADDDILIQRFATSNTARRRQFRYWQRHAQKLITPEQPSMFTINAIALGPSEEPTKLQHIPSVRTITQPPQSNHTKSIFTTTEATLFDFKLDLTSLETQSVVSSVTTARDLEGRPADLPPAPIAASRGQDFVCPYCFVLCPFRHGQGRAWR